MALIDKETIRTEIERRLKRENEILWNAKKRGTYPSPSCEYNLLTLTSLRDFLDSLPEQVNGPSRDQVGTKFAVEGLEEEYVRFAKTDHHQYQDLIGKGGIDIARHFAEWQKKQDQETIELAEDHAMLAGMNKMEQQMLEKAYDTVMQFDELDDLVPTFEDMQKFGFKVGDKVKVIILKEK